MTPFHEKGLKVVCNRQTKVPKSGSEETALTATGNYTYDRTIVDIDRDGGVVEQAAERTRTDSSDQEARIAEMIGTYGCTHTGIEMPRACTGSPVPLAATPVVYTCKRNTVIVGNGNRELQIVLRAEIVVEQQLHTAAETESYGILGILCLGGRSYGEAHHNSNNKLFHKSYFNMILQN